MIKRLLITLLLLVSFKQLSAVVCLPEWKYTRTITVNNANASAYTNFQVKVVLNTAALVAAGHCLSSKASHANSFGGV